MNDTTLVPPSELLGKLQRVRAEIYFTCFKRRRDALCNLMDAILSEPLARSLPEFSLSAFFERAWPSVYKALQEGKIDIPQLRALWANTLLSEYCPPDEPVLIAIDTSNIRRDDAETSEDRGYIHLSNLPLADKPIGVGWTYSTIVLLPDHACSWAPILDQTRVETASKAVPTAIEQLRLLKPLFGNRRVVVLADRGYATPQFLRACQDLGYSCLVRLKSDRKLFRPGVRVHQRGRAPKHGPLFQGKRPETHDAPDEICLEKDRQGKTIRTLCWRNLHFQEDPGLLVSAVVVAREAAKGNKRDPRLCCFVMVGEPFALASVAVHYRLRFCIEHCYRFLKQNLLWEDVHVHTPEQFDRWTWLLVSVFNQLCLARDLGQAAHRPWERKSLPITPQQVRRIMPSILRLLGTPAGPCQPRGKAPGRPVGYHPEPRERFPVILKKKKKEKKAEKPLEEAV